MTTAQKLCEGEKVPALSLSRTTVHRVREAERRGHCITSDRKKTKKKAEQTNRSTERTRSVGVRERKAWGALTAVERRVRIGSRPNGFEAGHQPRGSSPNRPHSNARTCDGDAQTVTTDACVFLGSEGAYSSTDVVLGRPSLRAALFWRNEEKKVAGRGTHSEFFFLTDG